MSTPHHGINSIAHQQTLRDSLTLKFIKSSTINTKKEMLEDINALIEDFNGDLS
jgi:hypothetical protein